METPVIVVIMALAGAVLLFLIVRQIVAPPPAKPCRTCGEPVGHAAQKCLHCGQPTTAGTVTTFINAGFAVLVLIFFAGLLRACGAA